MVYSGLLYYNVVSSYHNAFELIVCGPVFLLRYKILEGSIYRFLRSPGPSSVLHLVDN